VAIRSRGQIRQGAPPRFGEEEAANRASSERKGSAQTEGNASRGLPVHINQRGLAALLNTLFVQATRNAVPVDVTAVVKIEGLRQCASEKRLSAARAAMHLGPGSESHGRLRRVVRAD
jgi:hypothetical protein